MSAVTTKPVDPLAQIEAAQATLAAPDAPLDRLEAARLDLQRVIAAGEADLEASAARRKIELLAHAPAAEVDRKIEAIEKHAREVARRVEIAVAILGQLESRIAAAREVEIEAKRQARYDDATKLHISAAKHVREFLDRIAPEARKALQAYSESEAATRAVNADLPQGASPIRSIEAERQGDLTKPKVTERKFQAFVHGKDMVGEVGKVEALKNGNGNWAVYFRSNAVQGDWTVGPCTIVDYIEVTTQRYEPVRLEALATSLRVPAFNAPAPNLGRPERRVLPAEQAPLQIAAE
jgi:hypothetical protein